MASNRTPGPLGLWPEFDDVFARAGGPWEAWPSRPALPTGGAADLLDEAGPLGLSSPPLAPAMDTEDAAPPGPIERFRYMEIQGEVVKVRCVPLWQERVLGMLDGSDEDEKAQERLVRLVKGHHGQTRSQMVAALMNQLSEEGRSAGATAARLSQIRMPRSGDEEDAGPTRPGDRAGGSMARSLAGAGGRSVQNG